MPLMRAPTAIDVRAAVHQYLAVQRYEFLDRCPRLWHVAPAGAWEHIRRSGLRTAEQLIPAAEVDETQRSELLASPRPEPVALTVGGETVVLRDRAPLLKRKDLQSLMADGMDVRGVGPSAQPAGVPLLP